MGDEEGKSDGPEPAVVALARFSGHGLTLALSTGMFLLLGWWLDGRLGTTPVLTILGALVGAGAGFYSMIQHLLLRPRDQDGEKPGRGEP
jgi:F0F1-type ATP synthase assembly protein I